MGSWGFGVEQDDFVRDVLSDFDDMLRRGASLESATQALLAEFADAIDDPDDGPLLWLALARAVDVRSGVGRCPCQSAR